MPNPQRWALGTGKEDLRVEERLEHTLALHRRADDTRLSTSVLAFSDLARYSSFFKSSAQKQFVMSPFLTWCYASHIFVLSTQMWWVMHTSNMQDHFVEHH